MVGLAVGLAVTVTVAVAVAVAVGAVGSVLGVRPSMVPKRSVWSITPVTLAAWGPIAATRICAPVCVACCGGVPAYDEEYATVIGSPSTVVTVAVALPP
ncbi:hypothetical protein NOZE110980_18320 [Nocardioides zeicaulis]